MSEGEGPKRFEASQLDWTIVARPLLNQIREHREKVALGEASEDERIPVVIDLNFMYDKGLAGAKKRTLELIVQAASNTGRSPGTKRWDERKARLSQQYLFAKLEADVIEELARLSFLAEETGLRETPTPPPPVEGAPEADVTELGFIFRPVFMIWPDFEIRATTLKSISTVKADAAHRAFSAGGDRVVWAVLDSGIDGRHVHFQKHKNLKVDELDPPLWHKDFTRLWDGDEDEMNRRREESASALTDEMGHGTHVAGIIAGEALSEDAEEPDLHVCTRRLDERRNVRYRGFEVPHMSGMAPHCKLVSIKVLEPDGSGRMSNLLAAIAEIQKINEYGRWLKIHGVNLSVGYDFDPEWFACGQSPLCQEVDRLVKSGVVVVAAAGNTGYGFKQTSSRGAVASGMLMSINDPGNAELAITVGSTHREMPHIYGVSFFSSKGPTGDGRLKPDLVAPGERIISCAAGKRLVTPQADHSEDPHVHGVDKDGFIRQYVEDSGTSMAAPHVSGVIAAFLSIRREFIGRPQRVKEIFVSNATDLRRESYMQGQGLVDLMRSIQAV